MTECPPPALRPLVDTIEASLDRVPLAGLCERVKQSLQACIREGGAFLDPDTLEPHPRVYGRRLLYRDPAGRFSVILMVWGEGQGTPLHDHAGLWCVECVYRGSVRVRSYDLVEERPDGSCRFELAAEVVTGKGEGGALIPPYDHHVIDNPAGPPAATIHVYGGDMDWCHAFLPAGGGLYRREKRRLSFR